MAGKNKCQKKIGSDWMIQSFNNRTDKAGDDFKKNIGKESKLQVAAGIFSIYGFEALKAELKKTQDTEISVRLYTSYNEGMDLSGCRLLFIAQSEMKNIESILASVGDEPILTVRDTEECLKKGCMVALLSRMNKVRWAVNRGLANQAGLHFNSRILKMAVTIID